MLKTLTGSAIYNLLSSCIIPHEVGSSHTGEKNDCTVRALSNSTGLEYLHCHELLKTAGREDSKPCKLLHWWPVYQSCGFELQGIYGTTKTAKYLEKFLDTKSQKGCSLGSWLSKNATSTSNIFYNYVVLIRGHIFAVVDGKIIDKNYNKENSSVVAVFRVPKRLE